MSTKRFCDICDRELLARDSTPFARQLDYTLPGQNEIPEGQVREKGIIIASVQVTNRNNHILTDICHGCILRSVTDGVPVEVPSAIATLQPQVPADTRPPVALFEAPPPVVLPEKPPRPPEPPTNFEPSLQR